MTTVATIGYEGTTMDVFLERLRADGSRDGEAVSRGGRPWREYLPIMDR